MAKLKTFTFTVFIKSKKRDIKSRFANIIKVNTRELKIRARDPLHAARKIPKKFDDNLFVGLPLPRKGKIVRALAKRRFGGLVKMVTRGRS